MLTLGIFVTSGLCAIFEWMSRQPTAMQRRRIHAERQREMRKHAEAWRRVEREQVARYGITLRGLIACHVWAAIVYAVAA